MDEPLPNDDELDEPTADDAVAWDQPLLADDLEAAYLRALEATDAIEREIDTEPSVLPIPDAPLNVELASPSPQTSQPTKHAVTEPATPRVSEKQVVEAALFVGGMPLTAKKLSSLFHTDHGFGFVECLLDELNRQYADEGRPYSITLGEGGYRLSLLPEFESVRNKVFGYGPKDVKMTQDALEVLSLVAYKQPITKSQIEALGKSNAGSVLRQLVQRELIRIDRAHAPQNSKSKNDPPYSTTPRFLSLFGLGSLHDLPVAEDFAFK
ncbi:MAG: SMC-Scp complex subunit ScpB [Planctomycetota bacterium]|nr:MAG: SMC-Scp complex subunit ScpB [Planctomycetota bacterium]GDY07090.1 transcriptional regulator [Planctomycetia bacterium]